MHKLAVFDFDGTIAVSGRVALGIVEAFKHLQSLGYTTTISTGRGYRRLKDGLGEHFEELISPDALLIVEHGTRITDREGNTVFVAEFVEAEIEHIADFIRSNVEMAHFVWFDPPHPIKPQVWVVNPADLAQLKQDRTYYADVFGGSITDLQQRLMEHPFGHIGVRLKSHINVDNLKLRLTRSQIDLLFLDQNMNMIKNNVNKAIAIRYVEDKLGVSSEDLLVAGNAINDVEMLDTEAGVRIIVGPEKDTILAYMSNKANVISVASPQALGTYLQTL